MRRTERKGRTQRRYVRRSLIAAAVAVALGTSLAAYSDAQTSPPAEDALMGHAVDHLPNNTASDWVTYADHVVVVSATDEREIAPTEQELARGEGTIGRTVDLRVDKVLWSRTGAPRPAPSTWAFSAVGWQFTDGNTENRRCMALSDQPRVELGHQYVTALTWEEAKCSEGDAEPGQWRGLGEGSEVPFDGGILGEGELEGRTITAARALTAEPGDGLEDQVAGQGSDSLVQALKEATPQALAKTLQTQPQDTCG